MSEITLIIHGWSDCSLSFKRLKKYLIKQGIGKTDTILYADYESREDNITFDDVIDGLNDQMLKRGIIDRNGAKLRELNVIVHSTGGLIIRHWIWRYYFKNGNRMAECPVRRLIMLAPANFGSPLAHRGKSFLGVLFKGRWKIGDFLEVGRRLLEGLELASPYQWQLAHKDLLVSEPYFTTDQIQTSIMVGLKDYEGLRGWVNKPGTDGTVVIAGTSLDVVKLRLDFSKSRKPGSGRYCPHDWVVKQAVDGFAFGVLEGVDHGGVVEDAGKDNTQVSAFLMDALRTRGPGDFRRLKTRLAKVTEESYARTGKPRFQQFFLHVLDDQGVSIPDYTVEFFIMKAGRGPGQLISRQTMTRKELIHSRKAHAEMTAEIHTNSQDTSYRRLMVNIEKIKAVLKAAQQDMRAGVVLSMRMYVPDSDKGIRYANKNLQNIILYNHCGEAPDQPSFFYPNTTTFMEIKVDRYNIYVKIGREARAGD
ncbi:alpha/beta hydrolase [bacterium]|nr:alpha/beta hydrolase [bacterium]